MESIKFGTMITAMRNERKMTRKELAEKLQVTEKAVSKWELGKGYPEITLLPHIAEILGVTPGELLSGERNPNGFISPSEEDALVSDMIQFADKVSKFKASGIIFSLISMFFLAAILICLLCNYIISRTINWSLYPLGALLVVWCTLAPWFLAKKHRPELSLSALTITLVPYLFLIEYLCPAKGWVIPLALPVAGMSIAALFAVILLFGYTRINRFSLWAITVFLFGFLVNLCINDYVQDYLSQDRLYTSVIITAAASIAGALALSLTGYLRKKKNP